ncbi:hypothetical protein AAF712_013598 [Marasmius tenuissimus]|uniref:Uncharacterized protein n=1 Tax=Marasmius tenuissimus TaxID=585030 RepID=A0ABR2ZE74_9AGAR
MLARSFTPRVRHQEEDGTMSHFYEITSIVIKPPPNNIAKKIFFATFGGFGGLLLVASIICFIAWRPLGDPNPSLAKLALAVVLLIVIVIQAIFNLWQDYTTGRVMASIKNMLPSEIVVIRDGQVHKMPASELVSGDLVQLSMGNKIPADIRLIEVSSLSQSIARLECWDKLANVATDGGRRKKAHEEKYGTNDPSEIEHRSVQDAVEGKHFSAVVELIHREPFTSESKKLVLYVTDYTTNPFLSGTKLPAGIPPSLDGKVLKLALYDAHVQLSKHLKVGDFVSVRRMRITKNHTDGMSAKLGGEHPVEATCRTSTHKDLIAGLRRFLLVVLAV